MARSITEALKARSKISEAKDDELPQAEEGDGDHSPTVHSLVVKVGHPPGGALQTDIIANIQGPTGLISKRLVLPGAFTAVKLAALLEGIAGW